MAEQRWFYGSAAEWLAIADRLKLTPCPHCQVVGTLNRHGFLYGFDDSSPRRKTVRVPSLALVAFSAGLLPNFHLVGECLLHREFGNAWSRSKRMP